MDTPTLDPELERRARAGNAVALNVLIAALSEPDPLVRRAAADVLGRVRRVEAVPALLATLGDPASGVRWSAALALETIGDRRAIPVFIEALSDPVVEIRVTAARALGFMGDPLAVDPLRYALQDEYPEVRKMAVWALKTIGVQQATLFPATDEKTHSALPRLPDPTVERKRQSAQLLAATGGLAAAVALVLIWVWLWNRPLGPELKAPEFEALPRPTVQQLAEPLCNGPSVMYILLLGLDGSTDHLNGGFADVVRVARVDFTEPSLTMIAFPRDAWLRIPGLEARGIVEERLRTAYAYGDTYELPGGGVGLLADTLAYNFNVNVDHYVVGDFSAFVDVVDAIGGIEVNVPQPAGRFAAGRQQMDGATALQYARLRQDAPNPSDLYRIDRQTQVLLAVQEKVMRPEMLTRLPQLGQTLQEAVLTDLRPRDISALVCLGEQLDSQDITILDVDSGMFEQYIDVYGYERLAPDYSRIAVYLDAFYHGELDDQ